MNKSKIYELYFKTIVDSLEWGDDEKHRSEYVNYVSGMTDMVFSIINYIDKNKDVE